MNADGDDLPVEERRRLREQEEARRAAEHREGLLRAHMEPLARREALREALEDGTAGEKLKATLENLAANRLPTPKRYIPMRER